MTVRVDRRRARRAHWLAIRVDARASFRLPVPVSRRLWRRRAATEPDYDSHPKPIPDRGQPVLQRQSRGPPWTRHKEKRQHQRRDHPAPRLFPEHAASLDPRDGLGPLLAEVPAGFSADALVCRLLLRSALSSLSFGKPGLSPPGVRL